MMSDCRAPSALRMPISRVRSVTLTSMMFMMTMPPTTSEMQVTGTTTAAISPRIWSMKPRIASGVSDVEIVRRAGARVEPRTQRSARRSSAPSRVRPLSGRGRP